MKKLLRWTVSLALTACLAMTASACESTEAASGVTSTDGVTIGVQTPPAAADHGTQAAATAAPETGEALRTEGFGSAAAAGDTDLTIGEMLTYAIQDEYLARGEYAVILDAFGSQNPFANIIRAEQTHIENLLPLFTAYGFTAPEDLSQEHTIVPESLASALQAGVEAEIKNIAMYDRFLEQELPDDVRTVFLELRRASENHLSAFQRRLSSKRVQG